METFTITDKKFISGRVLNTRQVFYEAFRFSGFPNFLRFQVLRSLGTPIYQFITNNYALLHLCSKKNLLNLQKVSKYYKHGCRLELKQSE